MAQLRKLVLGLTAALTLTGATSAATVPFTDPFGADSSNWGDSASAPLSWSATGGADGGYAFGTFDFQSTQTGNDVIVLRSSLSMGSSGGELFGNWVTDGVGGFSADVRQDSGVPLTFFVRYASPMNFPGAVSLIQTQVPSGEWTQLYVPLPNPGLIFEGPFTYGDVFGNIGRVQLGVRVPEALAGMDTTVTFGLDNVSIVPEPATLLLLGLGGIAVSARRARSRGMKA